MTETTEDNGTDDQNSDRTEQWNRIEEVSAGRFDIAHSNGSMCFLVDEAGRPRSEGYHNIRVTQPKAGPDDMIRYIGEKGASENRISPIEDCYLITNTE